METAQTSYLVAGGSEGNQANTADRDGLPSQLFQGHHQHRLVTACLLICLDDEVSITSSSDEPACSQCPCFIFKNMSTYEDLNFGRSLIYKNMSTYEDLNTGQSSEFRSLTKAHEHHSLIPLSSTASRGGSESPASASSANVASASPTNSRPPGLQSNRTVPDRYGQ